MQLYLDEDSITLKSQSHALPYRRDGHLQISSIQPNIPLHRVMRAQATDGLGNVQFAIEEGEVQCTLN